MIRFAAVNLDSKSSVEGYTDLVKALAKDDVSRTQFLGACLEKLGLLISQDASSVPSLSCLHLSSLHHFLIPELLVSWKEIIVEEDGEEYIKGENDTFHVEKEDSRWSLDSLVTSLPPSKDPGKNPSDRVVDTASNGIIDYSKITKSIIPHEVDWPASKETPYFNHHSFYANLRNYQNEREMEAEVGPSSNKIICDKMNNKVACEY